MPNRTPLAPAARDVATAAAMLAARIRNERDVAKTNHGIAVRSLRLAQQMVRDGELNVAHLGSFRAMARETRATYIAANAKYTALVDPT